MDIWINRLTGIMVVRLPHCWTVWGPGRNPENYNPCDVEHIVLEGGE